MSRPKETRKKVDVAYPSEPLGHNPFAMLGEMDALKNLPKSEPAEKEREPHVVPAVPSIIPKNSRGRLVLRRETKARGGKIVVVISGFTEVPGASAVMIGNLARELKGKLGCGGSFDRQEIVLQGDRCAEVAAQLENSGFRVVGTITGP